MNDNRLNEAEECIRKAEKYLKTSLMKWKPDYDSAAVEYDRAGICFKNLKKFDSAFNVYLKAAECYENNGNIFHAAKSKEQAAMIAKETGKTDKAIELMEKAAQMYAESGTLETSAMALDKTGKFFETVDMEKAIKIYEQGLRLVHDNTDKSKMASEFLRRITYIHLKLENYKKAAENIKQEIELYKSVSEPSKVAKLVVGLVLIDLAMGDSILARKDLDAAWRVPGFAETGDAPLLDPLISAYEQADEEKFRSVLNHPHIKSNDNEILRLMKKINVPKIDKKSSDVNVEDYGDGGDQDEDASGLL